MKLSQARRMVVDGHFDGSLCRLYGDQTLADQRERLVKAVDRFSELYGERIGPDGDVVLLSVPGRSEICGNHTDHNHGRVLAASVNLDIIAVAAPVNEPVVCVKSEGFEQDAVSLATMDTAPALDRYRAVSILRGVCDGFHRNGWRVGGFCAYTVSDVLKGSGLSSSAAYEVMVGNILNHLYNEARADALTLAKIAQYAENEHFGKPCGLMDQTACAVGGVVAIDFADIHNPKVERLTFDLSVKGLALCIVNTGGNHADLNEEYAAIPTEMKSVASLFGQDVLRGISKQELLHHAGEIREKLGDRALLRAIHFTDENERVREQTEALKRDDIDSFLAGIRASGLSSQSRLENIYACSSPREQGIAVALMVAQEVLGQDVRGAYRVHGGGFAGTIQAFVPFDRIESFRTAQESVFGKGSVYVLNVRPYGAVSLEDLVHE